MREKPGSPESSEGAAREGRQEAAKEARDQPSQGGQGQGTAREATAGS